MSPGNDLLPIPTLETTKTPKANRVLRPSNGAFHHSLKCPLDHRQVGNMILRLPRCAIGCLALRTEPGEFFRFKGPIAGDKCLTLFGQRLYNGFRCKAGVLSCSLS